MHIQYKGQTSYIAFGLTLKWKQNRWWTTGNQINLDPPGQFLHNSKHGAFKLSLLLSSLMFVFRPLNKEMDQSFAGIRPIYDENKSDKQ